MKKVPIQVFFDEETKSIITEKANERALSLSSYIREIVILELKKNKEISN